VPTAMSKSKEHWKPQFIVILYAHHFLSWRGCGDPFDSYLYIVANATLGNLE